jgi:hypothetical protein
MLHIRVVSPPGATEDLIGRLAADPGIRNLILLPGAARHPDGDAVQFDLLDRFANQALERLRAELGVDGSIAIEYVDASITGPATHATQATPATAATPGTRARAMVVGPEYGAIMATALGLDKRDRGAIRRGLIALVAGFTLAVLIAVGAGGLRLQRAVWRNRSERAAAHPGRPAPPPTA